MSIAQLDLQPALIDQVHDRLLAAIIDGTLAPGRRLTQGSVADMLGVSRQPVSHAIQVLRRRGLLIESGKRGVAVAPIDAARIRDLYQVRAAVDGLAAELAAARCGAGSAPRAEIAKLKSALDAGSGEATTAGTTNFGHLIEADVAFHSALHTLSGNPAIAETVAEQWPHFRRSMRRVLEGVGVAPRVWQEHKQIFDAVTRGDAAEAGRLAREHAIKASEETVRRLEARQGGATANIVERDNRPKSTRRKAR